MRRRPRRQRHGGVLRKKAGRTRRCRPAPVAADCRCAGRRRRAKHEPTKSILALGDREWRVRGLAKNTGFESLKVTLRVTCAERWHLDQLDLCVARQRDHFVTRRRRKRC